MTYRPSRISGSFSPSARSRSTRAATTRGWMRRDVDVVLVDHRLGAGELRRTDLAAEVLAAAEGDVQAELLVEQHLADRRDAEVGEHPEAELGEVAVGRLRRQALRLAAATRARRRATSTARLPSIRYTHDLVAELHRQHAGARARVPGRSPS